MQPWDCLSVVFCFVVFLFCFWHCGFDMFYWSFFVSISIKNQVRSVDQIVLWWFESSQWTVHCIVPDGKINLLRTQLTVWANVLRFHPAPENKEVNHFGQFCLFAVSLVESREWSSLNFVEPKTAMSAEMIFALKMPAVKKTQGLGHVVCES